MKICISATSSNLDAQLDPRFGRCLYFIIVNTENMKFDAIPNAATNSSGGAGIQAAQTIANKGVKTVITGSVGPNAFEALSVAGIEILTVSSGIVKEVIEKFKKGELQRTKAPTNAGHNEMNKGSGRGIWEI